MRQLEDCARSTNSSKRDTQVEDTPASCPEVILARKSAFPTPVQQSFPALVFAASRKENDIRLVEISPDAEASLTDAVGLPRCSVLGIRADNSAMAPVIDYVRAQVEPVNAPWLGEKSTLKYLPLKVDTSTVAGPQKSFPKSKTEPGEIITQQKV
jgi:hypothetical protein